MNENDIINAEILAIFNPPRVYLVGNKSLNNLKDIIIESLLFMGEYVIDKFNYRPVDLANHILKYSYEEYKNNIELDYKNFKNNYDFFKKEKKEDNHFNYNSKFILALLKEDRMTKGEISLIELEEFWNELFKEVIYSLFIDHSFESDNVNEFINNDFIIAFRLISTYYAQK